MIAITFSTFLAIATTLLPIITARPASVITSRDAPVYEIRPEIRLIFMGAAGDSHLARQRPRMLDVLAPVPASVALNILLRADGSAPPEAKFSANVIIDGIETNVQCQGWYSPRSAAVYYPKPSVRVKLTQQCQVVGTLKSGLTHADFSFFDGKQYLSRCGPGIDGITLMCGGELGGRGADCDLPDNRWKEFVA